MKITVLTPTFNRPQCLGRLVRCFLDQTYHDKQLVILDDACQHPATVGDRWRIVAWPCRFPTLGHKRNALLDLAGCAQAIVYWDDDDLYLPHALSACVAALEQHPWAQSTLVYEKRGRKLVRRETFGRGRQPPGVRGYPGTWAFRREVLDAVAWAHTSSGADQTLATEIAQRFGPPGDTISESHPEPFMVYSYPTRESPNLSRFGPGNAGYEKLGQAKVEPRMLLEIPVDVPELSLPVAPGVQPRGW